ncbi:hypothetical protein SUGI_0069610 [Cryptomeria japonica]|nr:hypothetical protein SUGI_0069610 [Cryptomeria japonica]
MDNTHKHLEGFIWVAQREERQNGMGHGIFHSHLHSFKEALELMKEDYLKLLRDKHMAVKLVKDKDKEIADHCLLLCMSNSLYNSENRSLITATSIKENDNARGIEIEQIDEVIEELHLDDIGNCENQITNERDTELPYNFGIVVENQYFGPAFDKEHSTCVEDHEITSMELDKSSDFQYGDNNYIFPLESEMTSL